MRNDLIGLKYPITDIDNNVVATRIINDAKDVENMAAIVISLNSKDSVISIGLLKAEELIKNNKAGKYDNLPVLNN
jgi:hypothetical protein